MKKIIFLVSLLVILAGCSDSTTKSKKMVIYTTNYASRYIIKEIASDNVDVYSIYNNLSLKEDDKPYQVIDPSKFNFKDEARIRKNLLKADMFVYNGFDNVDKRLVSEFVEYDKDEEVQLFDSTLNAGKSTINTVISNVYNGTVVNPKLNEILTTTSEPTMYWLSPTDLMKVSGEIYDMLILNFPDKKEEFKANYDALIYEISALYADLDEIYEGNINNTFVSDSYQLSILNVHYFNNIYTDNKHNKMYSNDETNEAYLNKLGEFVQINQTRLINTKDPLAPNYFDLLVTLSENNYNEGKDFLSVMKENYKLLNQVLAK